LATTGCRLTEALKLTWSDVNFENSTITIRGDLETGTKNWKIRTNPMIPELSTFLSEEFNRRKPLDSRQTISEVKEAGNTLRKACKDLGIRKLVHKDFRDLFATRCIEQGVDIPTVAKWLGHSDGGALLMSTYSHLRQHHSNDMAKRVSFGI